ncbi:2-dehydropantoate 2-reductase [Litorivivens lipolytica]|uniref:2-dehydropantoate 2-reductase n=1 Tax=Litorivivens lipolytica TaxID=1524264 RepID=A0A7W4W444_9GAMM|nr:2-dehydropantoate 2-reductase [Litorivivens lipolytica]MBB3047049.1 2-dehydropantoate 2-reductase [Litorivivens lipolytica]
MTNPALPKVCIYGAGSIGAYVGGRLQAAGVEVSFIGRERIARQVAEHGLHLTDWQGADIHLPVDTIRFTTEDASATEADVIIVAVKSAATDEVGKALRGRINSDVAVVSLQNGIGNARTLAKHLPDNPVLTGMISFNVLQRGNGHFHAGTEGELMCDPHPRLEALLDYFQAGDLPLELRPDMHAVQWAKLLMNLNNPLNALSGIPLHDELSQRDYRRSLALLIDESLSVLKRSEIRPAKLMPVPMSLLPWVLRTPDWLFARLAKQMLAIDPLARSSMWEDLEAGRVTEIDWINGEVVRQAQKVGASAAANLRVIELVKAAEKGGKRDWSGAELLSELKRALAAP